MSQHVVKVQGRWQPPPPQPPQQPLQQLQPHFIFLQILVFFLFDSMRLSLCRFKTEPPPSCGANKGLFHLIMSYLNHSYHYCKSPKSHSPSSLKTDAYKMT